MHIVYVEWDIEEYTTQYVFVSAADQIKNQSRFPCPNLGKHDHPLTVVDCKGRILLWYLPKLLSLMQQVRLKNQL